MELRGRNSIIIIIDIRLENDLKAQIAKQILKN